MNHTLPPRFFYPLFSVALFATACTSTTPLPSSSTEFDPNKPLGPYADKFPPANEEMPGGTTTNKHPGGKALFDSIINELEPTQLGDLLVGAAFFQLDWNSPPSSTNLRDGLGPFFNAKACQRCHVREGRTVTPQFPEKWRFDNNDPTKARSRVDCGNLGGMLFRISIPTDKRDPNYPDIPLSKEDPVYGSQLEPLATNLMPKGGEGIMCLKWQVMSKNDFDGQYVVDLKQKDGSTKTIHLARPNPFIPQWNYGDPLKRTGADAVTEVYISPRVAPQLPGMGLLEAIPIESLQALADPNDRDNDGVSGRLIIVPKFTDMYGGVHTNLAGRFGWKAEQATVSSQTSIAFLADMGLTTPLHPKNLCPDENDAPELYKQCIAAAIPTIAGEPEVGDKVFRFTTSYTSSLAVPRRKNFFDDDVIRGWRLFRSVGCAKCHHPSFTTKQRDFAPISKLLLNADGKPLFDNQEIYPYTDLLVHDMGPGLCDGRPPFSGDAAGPCEWRTPPLWGVGRIPLTNGHQQLLHDGRATGVEEAILWHGGEARRQKENYVKLNPSDREALIAFVNSL